LEKKFRHGASEESREKKCRASARLGREGLNVAAELETVFEEREAGDEGFGSDGFDFSDDGLESVVRNGAGNNGSKVFNG
jgi:hypothetical protein